VKTIIKSLWVSAVLLFVIVPVVSADPPESINLRKTIVVQVVAETKNAVVKISTTKTIRQWVSPFGADPFFQQFGHNEAIPANSLGSGFIIHRDGYVVTNNHVVDRAREITVELDDGRKLPADLISTDPEADLALLKISDKNPFATIQLGDSSDLMIGEPAIAIGNPLGYSHSVSTGIVSALHRDLKDVEGKESLDNLIQTDAAINPGNSGGPLLNAYGQVIGINTAIRSDAQNIGFAIPVNRLRDLIPELMNPAQALKLEIPLKLKERRTISEPADVKSEVVTEDGSHVVKEIDGKHPENIIDAYDELLAAKSGQHITVTFADGTTKNFTSKPTPVPDVIIQAKAKLGISVEQLTPMLAQAYHLDQEDGIFITGVESDSVCGRAGVKAGDILIQLGRYRIPTLEHLGIILEHLPKNGRVGIAVIRDDRLASGYLTFGKVEDEPDDQQQ
jgi:serine protease Do